MIGFPSAPAMVASASTGQSDTIWSFFSGGGRSAQPSQPEARPAPPPPAPEPPPVQVASRPEPPPPPEPVRVAAAPVESGAAPAETGDADPSPPEPIRVRQPSGAVPLPPPRPFDLGSNRSAFVVAAVVPSSSVSSVHAVMPPRRPNLHASAERAPYDSGPARLPPKRPTSGAVDHLKSAKSARADY
jgi:hypothetical protein